MSFDSVRFGNLFALPQRNGLTRPKKVRGSGVPMVNMGELFAHQRIGCLAMDRVPLAEFEAGFLLEPGDLLFARQSLVLAGAGQCSVFQGNDEPTTFESHLIRCRLDRERANSTFYFYFFRSREGREVIEAIVEQGAGASGIRGSDLVNVLVPFPPKALQDGVAAVLTVLDDRIALLRETNATLESIAQALFKSWFVDFDPVRAKQQVLAPVGMDETTAALFPIGFDDSALGSIPSGWQVRPIADVVDAVFDGPHATPPESDEGPVFLGIKNLTGTALDLSEIRHIAEADFAQWTKRATPRPGDIVFSYEATLGFFGLIPPGLRCCLGRRLALIRPQAEQSDSHFWFHQFIAAPFQRLLARHTIQGATVNRIALKHFPSYSVLCPPAGMRTAFDACMAPLWSRIHANQAQAQTLTALRNNLLPRLISGQLRLPEAEALAA